MIGSTPEAAGHGSTGRRIGLLGPDRGMSDGQRLGRSDYSYHFVLRYFEKALRNHDDVRVLADDCQLDDPDQVNLCFLPPHRLPENAGPNSHTVFAWEYDTIPTDAWNDDDRNDWRNPLRGTGGSIVHSQYAAEAVAAALPDHRVCSAPAPVWDAHAPLASESKPDAWSLEFDGWVMDSHALGLDRGHSIGEPDFTVRQERIDLSGIVYTCVVNPDDGRKNWVDAMSAFTIAFRDNPNATLLIKLVHHDPVRAGLLVADMLYRAAPYQCRVVAMFGYLPAEQYRLMILGSSFVVNSSRGEGQCLPLMEFMSAGVPAVAPDHTAMAEYVTPDNGFIVRTFRERTHWPHDPRLLLRCTQFGINWVSLRDAYLTSWQVLTTDPHRYTEMASAASEALEHHASTRVVTARLRAFLDAGDRDDRQIVRLPDAADATGTARSAVAVDSGGVSRP